MRKLILGVGLGYAIPWAEQINSFATVGWDGFFTGWDEQNGNLAYRRLADSLGMIYQSIHAPFDRTDLIWESGEAGERETDRLIACVEECARCEVNIAILHTIIGMTKCTPTAIGSARYGRILDRARELGVTVALENTEGEVYLDRLVTDHAWHSALGFCIDTGHELCYNGGRDMIGKYKSILVATHLNDNLGQTAPDITYLDDSHLLPFDGIADWQGVANRLNAADYTGPLTFELTTRSKPGRTANDVYSGLTLADFAAEAHTRAKKFAKMCK